MSRMVGPSGSVMVPTSNAAQVGTDGDPCCCGGGTDCPITDCSGCCTSYRLQVTIQAGYGDGGGECSAVDDTFYDVTVSNLGGCIWGSDDDNWTLTSYGAQGADECGWELIQYMCCPGFGGGGFYPCSNPIELPSTNPCPPIGTFVSASGNPGKTITVTISCSDSNPLP